MAYFIPPMLCERLTNISRLADRNFIAEPKLDSQRAQLYVHSAARRPVPPATSLARRPHAGSSPLCSDPGMRGRILTTRRSTPIP